MSSGSAIAAGLLKGGQKLTGQMAKHQSTMNDVHAVAIQNHYTALMHQNEHSQHLEAVKQAHEIAGNRGFSVRTNNRSFQVGDAAEAPKKPKKSKGPKSEAAPEAAAETPSMGGGSGSSAAQPERPAIETKEIKTKPLAIEAKPASFDNGNIWRMGSSGVTPSKPPTSTAQHHAASPRQFVTGPEGTTRRVDRTDSSFEQNLTANEDRYLAERKAQQAAKGN